MSKKISVPADLIDQLIKDNDETNCYGDEVMEGYKRGVAFTLSLIKIAGALT
jgi:hypothetical protein